MATAIEFNHVGKQYRLGLVSTGTISHDLNRWWQTAILRREDPYLKIGSVNDRTQKADSDYVWALRDIDFKVEQGDVVGIIGKNGAGKSTLLKLLSKVTAPTVGTIRARGRIASLLEVGTGFHQEMTGRENIYMNGAILGMTKREIASKLDEIVDFSGCERYLDTPVKRYSSGMMVRLGFAVAAHLDPEILVVDEVLAVGDAEFQKKAIGKMKEVSEGQGRTVLFVSHNMTSIRNLCHSGVILEKGEVIFQGDAQSAVDQYILGEMSELKTNIIFDDSCRGWYLNRNIELISARLLNKSATISQDEDILIDLYLRRNMTSIDRFNVITMISNAEERRVGTYVTPLQRLDFCITDFRIQICLKQHNLAKGKYSITFSVGLESEEEKIFDLDYDEVIKGLSFEVAYRDLDKQHLIQHWSRAFGNIDLSKSTASILV